MIGIYKGSPYSSDAPDTAAAVDPRRSEKKAIALVITSIMLISMGSQGM